MSGETEGGLARWSRLKRAARTAPVVEHEDKALPSAGPADGTPAPVPADSETPVAAAARPPLPDIADLDRTSDFTPFLQAEVPEALHRQALRALWHSDPLFAHRDGLTDYDEDYTAIGIVACEVRTAYRPGAGYAEEVAAAPVPDSGVGEVADDADDTVDDSPGASAVGPSGAEAGAASPAPDLGTEESGVTSAPASAAEAEAVRPVGKAR